MSTGVDSETEFSTLTADLAVFGVREDQVGQRGINGIVGDPQVGADLHDLAGAASEQELKELLDRHGPGRVMFRNTRSGVGVFPCP